MSTEPARTTGSTLAIRDDQSGFNAQQIAALRQLGVEGATDGDLAVFFHQSQRSGLDPFKREIYMIGRNTKNRQTGQWETKYTIQTGIDGFYKIADRVSRRTGGTWGISETYWCGEDGVWRDVWLSRSAPAAAKVVVERNGSRFVTVALMAEYNPGQGLWQKMPARMIAKCAEALAIRKAFPEDLSGLYTGEEMAQADHRVEQVPTAVPSPVSALSATEPDAITDEQKKAIAAAMKARGLGKGELLALAQDVTGREVTGANDLTADEAALLLAAPELAEPAEVIDGDTGEVLEAELLPSDESDPWVNPMEAKA